MKALLIIDAQNDFMPGGALSVPEGDQIVPVMNAIQKHFDLIIASQDWHPENHVSFASNHSGKSEFDEIEVHGKPQTLWPNHCVQTTAGADFHSELDTSKWETIFRKGTDPEIDSYSAFYDNGHLKSTGLTGYLKEKKVTDIYMGGLAADICVYYSLIDAAAEGFNCYFVEDASKPLDVANFEKLKQDMISRGIKIISSDEI